MPSQLVGFTSNEARDANIASGRFSAAQANSVPVGGGADNTVNYDSKTGARLAPGQSTTDSLGNTYKQGQQFGAPVSPAVSTKNTPAMTTQPSPATTNATSGLPGAPATSPIPSTPLTPQQMASDKGSVGVLSPQAQGQINAQKSGTPPPQGNGTATTITSQYTPPDNSNPALPQSVQDYLNPKTNPNMSDNIQAIRDMIEPQSVRDQLAKEFSQLTHDQSGLNADKLKLMNMKQLMAGTEADIRKEITTANGFATNSQVMAMAVARNTTLQTQVTQLEDQIALQQDQVSTDTSIYNNDKATAASEATQAMGIWDHLQTAQQNTENAYKDGIKTMIASVGISGLYNGLMNTDPTGANAAAVASHFGWTPAQFQAAAAEDLKTQKAQQALQEGNLNIQKSQLAIQKAQLDAAKNPADIFAMPGESDKSKVFSAIPKLDTATQKTIDMSKLATDPKYFYWVKSQIGL
jgi:hypothetical protein